MKNKLEPGDEIYTVNGWHKHKIIVGKIDRTTKTLAFIGNRKFRIEIDDEGRVDVVQRSYSHASYYLLTDDVKKKIAEQEYRIKKENIVVAWGGRSLAMEVRKLPLSKLERIVEVLEETD